MLLEGPEEVTSMLMPMEFSRLSTTLLMTSMDSELLEPISQSPLRLLLLLDQLLLLQLLWLHQWPLRRHLKWLLLELNILLLMLKPRLTVWKREKLSLLMEIMKFLLPLSFTILFRPSLPQHPLLLPSQIPTSFQLTKSLPLSSLPLFLPLLLNLSLTKLLLPLPLLLPQLLSPWLPQFQLLPLLSLLQASSMLRMSLDSSALDTRTSTPPRLKLRMLLE